MSERSITVGVNGGDHTISNIRTGLPQGSPISPLLFAAYVGGVNRWVRRRVPGARGLSFVNDMLWLVTGTSVKEVAKKLERSAGEAVKWGERNAISFESRKMEAILFSRNRRYWRDRREEYIKVQGRTVPFNRKATRWLGVWIDSRLSWKEHIRVYEGKARRVERRISSLVRKNGVPPI